MNMYYYQCEKRNKVVHDGVREYCLCERVNEEYLRTLIERHSYLSTMNKPGFVLLQLNIFKRIV